MTEPFEDIVRDALRGTSGAADEMPTYHGAWQRGRRRRLIKRSALVATGAFVLLAALTVNLGRFLAASRSKPATLQPAPQPQ